MVRRLLVLVVALLLAVQVVRNAAANALFERSPGSAGRFWSGHPSVEIAQGMTEIGQAAHDQKPVSSAIFAKVDDAAIKAPLAPEPFLVRGVQNELAGNTGLAAQAFMAAEQRDARSLPAHYFLADVFYRQGNGQRTLDEVGLLARLAPHGVESVAPYIATIAKDRSTWPQLKRLFRDNANLEDASLSAMAADPANADAVLMLATRHPAAKANWPASLVNSLAGAGQYERARAVWAAMSNVRLAPGSILYDSGFTDAEAPPPFNWLLSSSTVGLAEREKGGRLEVIFYAQQDGVLAKQLLLLPAGTYRLTSPFSGDAAHAGELKWSLRCDRSDTPLASAGLDEVSHGWSFTVPSDCKAQWLELSGVSSDVAAQVDVVISNLRLVPERAHD